MRKKIGVVTKLLQYLLLLITLVQQQKFSHAIAIKRQKINLTKIEPDQAISVLNSSSRPTSSHFSNALSGLLATILSEASMQPVDCIKTFQQSNNGIGVNILDAGKKILQNSGVRGFYSGLGTNLSANGIAGAIKFTTYESLKVWTQNNVRHDLVQYALYLCAGFSFMTSSIVSVPGELIKQRQQMGQIQSSGLVRGIIPSIWKNEGLRGFFKGTSGIYLRDIPYTMLELGLYDNLKHYYLQYKIKKKKSDYDQLSQSISSTRLTQFDEIVIAAITGGVAGYLTAPLDTIKTKLILDNDQQLYNGFIDCVSSCVKENGVASLFQGSLARVIWLVPSTVVYLQVYEVMRRFLNSSNQNPQMQSAEVSTLASAS